MKKALILAAILFCTGSSALAQGPNVTLAPVAHQQFFGANGAVLSGGCIYTFQSGTSTPQATYVDGSSGTQNQNPIILDSGGFANIWLTNSAYRFVVWSFGSGAVGSNCGNGTQQYTIDNINPWNVINLPSNLFLAGSSSDPGGTAGELAYRTDIPCFRFFTTFWDCVVRLTDTQILTNKTFDISANTLKNSTNTAGHYPRNGGSGYVDSAIQSADLPNAASYTNSSTGTGTNLIAKLATNAGASQAQSVAITDTGGAVGICISGCGATGTAQISTVGVASCVFDGATTAGDYAQISGSVAGDCHDVGNAFPSTGQVLGRVLSTNASGGTYSMTLFGPEIKPPGVGSGGAIILQTLTDQTVTGTTMTNVPAITFAAAANTNYRATCFFWGNAVTGGTAQMQWTGPASPTSVIYTFNGSSGATSTAFSTPASFSSNTGLSGFAGSIALINGANAGTVQLQMDNTTGGDGVLLKAGSYCIVQ